MSTLFVNACLRGKESHTLVLCRDYLASKQDIVEIDADAQMNLARAQMRKLL